MRLAGLGLRLRLMLRALGPLPPVALLLCGVGVAALAWLQPARAQREQQQLLATAAARLPPPVVTAAPVAPDGAANLALFQAALGYQRALAPQLGALFGIAADTGLVLRQGEYKRGVDRNAGLYTYQINLPVQGSYAQVSQFALLALRAIPYAALDDISFRRDAIGDSAVDARLRLTLYLRDAPGAAP